jgi:hypothetical protein
MKYIIVAIVFFILPCCLNVTNEVKSKSIDKKTMIIKNRSATIVFKRVSNNEEIKVLIEWEKNLGAEYTEFGSIASLIITEKNQIFKTVNYNIHSIEDFDLNSVKLSSPHLGKYDLSMIWGAGENRSYPNILSVE